jgi:hypothetical protein
MLPKITNPAVWKQAEMLMQPSFIRIVDNLRKHLDVSSWTGVYADVLIWPPGTTDEVKALVTNLLQDLEAATPERVEEIRGTLAHLPVPHPGYHLRLQRQEQHVSIDLWDLCYQVCFLNYSSENDYVVIVDTSLIDEFGEVDWQKLEEKTKGLVGQVFANLPEI